MVSTQNSMTFTSNIQINWTNLLLLASLTLLALFLPLQIHHPFLLIHVIGRLPMLLDLVLLDYTGFPEAPSLLSTVLTLRKMAAQVANYLSLLSSSLTWLNSPEAFNSLKGCKTRSRKLLIKWCKKLERLHSKWRFLPLSEWAVF